ncbi:MAG: DNA polymerase IV [Dehalococcoidia bacterium]|nr:DNA polymerase IV [Dehalococcoidia bacterium]
MDAFYASVEQLDRPELRGKPVLVGGRPNGRGVVAACSYEARAFGVHSAMPMSRAVRLCPQGVIVAPRFDRYHEISQQVMAIFRESSAAIEPLSLDEAYLDVTARAMAGEAPEAIARAIKRRVKEEVKLTVSVGAGTSKSVAKIASDMKKPDGLVVVPPGGERGFLAPLPVRRLSGVGPRTEERLLALGIRTLGELAQAPDAFLQREFGMRGPELGALSRGEDTRPVIARHETKSVSAESTFARDLGDGPALLAELRLLAERVDERLRDSGLRGRTITLKLRLADFTTFTRSVTLPHAAEDAVALLESARALLEREWGNGRRFRLLGLGVSGFHARSAATRQPALFDLPDAPPAAQAHAG